MKFILDLICLEMRSQAAWALLVERDRRPAGQPAGPAEPFHELSTGKKTTFCVALNDFSCFRECSDLSLKFSAHQEQTKF